MDHSARDLMEEYPDIILGFGESDEFRLVVSLVLVGDSETISDLNRNFTMAKTWPAFLICLSSMNLFQMDIYSFRTVSFFENRPLSTTDVNPRSSPL